MVFSLVILMEFIGSYCYFQQTQYSLFVILGLPKNFTNPLELYQTQDNCQNNENNVYEESLVSDSNDQDQSMLDGLNGSGSVNGNLNASNR